jgi:hypothetical protein
MSDFSRVKDNISDVGYKNEDDPDVDIALLMIQSDQTDPLVGFVTFAWKTKHGHFTQTFGPFSWGLPAELFAQERWPKAYKAWDEKRTAAIAARGIVLAHPVP